MLIFAIGNAFEMLKIMVVGGVNPFQSVNVRVNETKNSLLIGIK